MDYVEFFVLSHGRASLPEECRLLQVLQNVMQVLFHNDDVFDNFLGVMAPFLTVHGTTDRVMCQTSSQLLYDKQSSVDKTLKIYDRMYHSLVQGEPDENTKIVLKDMREWIDERVARYGSKAKGLEEGI
ncbi:caffeoylshikimate esterase [Pyrus ussuriensis x Pyrus communis]|uniref:Caffeoylshikimate esterase n=1 Tax=Pyrus ussuriensis x Pyrus communis TaxID=2448454 RepID=A0A5N5G841_9ROSA|nr:caffeoylshikimate esterase [Pyrus ussuriensis x Pyrus communis]